MTLNSAPVIKRKKEKPAWMSWVRPYQTPEISKSVRQIITTFVPFFTLWILMYYSLRVSYVLTLLLAIVEAGFVVRMFIIQHDCGHGSYFKERKWNDRVGFISGLFTLVPYYHWRKMHAIHHANAGKLEDTRGIGDFYTWTVDEYLARSKKAQLGYRIYRNPIFLICVLPFIAFVIAYRIPFKMTKEKGWKKERYNVYWTNLGIAIVTVFFISLFGFKEYLLIQIPIVYLATTIGAWFFFVQHQFEDAYWAKEEEWDYASAALQGSSYYKLPKVLQWFTGNIGFHHIHHLSPKIPNYKLQACHEENPELQDVHVLTLRSSFDTLDLALFDEENKKMISFRELKKRQAA